VNSKDTHWEKVYQTKNFDSVSWYTSHLKSSLSIISELSTDINKSIIDIGGGESTLLDDLIIKGHTNLSVIDISPSAIKFLQNRLKAHLDKIGWHIGDITDYKFSDNQFDLWHDRAVFHFLTDVESRSKYKKLLYKAVKKDGYVVVATFGPDGPLKCSGLTVERYSAKKLDKELGVNFKLLGSKLEEHHTPFNTIQQFLYCWFQVV
jgi:SAM-dependent methyltransferase